MSYFLSASLLLFIQLHDFTESFGFFNLDEDSFDVLLVILQGQILLTVGVPNEEDYCIEVQPAYNQI